MTYTTMTYRRIAQTDNLGNILRTNANTLSVVRSLVSCVLKTRNSLITPPH